MERLIADQLPREVVDFVKECRQESYKIGAKPNFKTGRPNESAFRFEHDKMVLVDVSYEMGNSFSGVEEVYIKSSNPALNKQRVYVCQYTGLVIEGVNPKIDQSLHGEVQHQVVIENPTLVRFGRHDVKIEKVVNGAEFLYMEQGFSFGQTRVNSETLSRARGMGYLPVYKGSHQITLFHRWLS